MWLIRYKDMLKTQKRVGLLESLNCCVLKSLRTVTEENEEEDSGGADWHGSPLMPGSSQAHRCVCVSPSSLKIHYTCANGGLMRTSLVDRPSYVAQGKLITAWFPQLGFLAGWEEKRQTEQIHRCLFWWLAAPSLVAVCLKTRGSKGWISTACSRWNAPTLEPWFFLKKVLLSHRLRIFFYVDKWAHLVY